ncbi:UNVERIFIED_CONTAM: hypothetical protein BEN50_11905 [Euhalothece sp. KZN 001]
MNLFGFTVFFIGKPQTKKNEIGFLSRTLEQKASISQRNFKHNSERQRIVLSLDLILSCLATSNVPAILSRIPTVIFHNQKGEMLLEQNFGFDKIN